MEIAVKQTVVGVLVGRFQTHKLHEGHHKLIQTVMQHHQKVVVFLGVSPAKSTKNNPLDFKSREMMLHESYPDLTIIPIYDVHNDDEWSKELDKKIREVFSIGSVTLYGSRNSFIPHYSGQFPTVELDETYKVSGSEIRKSISHEVSANPFFRQGIIYASHDKYPTSYTTVDAAILDEKGNILLARKKNDPKGKWRFIGGFVDINKDETLEEAVKREVLEETNSLGVGEPIYIGSAKIDDWRYRNEQDGIMTSLFVIPYLFGAPKATDDIDELEWFDIKSTFEDNDSFIIVEEHKILATLLKAYLNRKQKTNSKEKKS